MKPHCYAVAVAAACLWLHASVAYSQNTILADDEWPQWMAAGRTVHTGTLQHGHVEAIEGLPMGVYAVRATEYQTSLLHTIKSASFVVVR